LLGFDQEHTSVRAVHTTLQTLNVFVLIKIVFNPFPASGQYASLGPIPESLVGGRRRGKWKDADVRSNRNLR
jgi:hypothetical protein